jgi:hypothetical protein
MSATLAVPGKRCVGCGHWTTEEPAIFLPLKGPPIACAVCPGCQQLLRSGAPAAVLERIELRLLIGTADAA